MRVTPPIVEICDDINAICPNAFVFNYTNPMQRVCQTVTTKYPGMKFVGLCHEIASMERQLPDMMDTPFNNIQYRAGGLNHFSIFLSRTKVPHTAMKPKHIYQTLHNFLILFKHSIPSPTKLEIL